MMSLWLRLFEPMASITVWSFASIDWGVVVFLTGLQVLLGSTAAPPSSGPGQVALVAGASGVSTLSRHIHRGGAQGRQAVGLQDWSQVWVHW